MIICFFIFIISSNFIFRLVKRGLVYKKYIDFKLIPTDWNSQKVFYNPNHGLVVQHGWLLLQHHYYLLHQNALVLLRLDKL